MLKINLKGLSNEESMRFLVQLLSTTFPEPLSDMEVKLLAAFMVLPYDKYRHQRFSSHARKKVYKYIRSKYGWEFQYSNLNAKVNALYRKGLLYRDEENQLHLVRTLDNLFYKYIKESKEVFELQILLPAFKDDFTEYTGNEIVIHGKDSVSQELLDNKKKTGKKD